MSYLEEHGSRTTPQSRPARADQVENSAGGYGWAVDPSSRLRRFLILGSEGGSFYAGEYDLTAANVAVLEEFCASGRGVELVEEIVAISVAGRAPSNDPALFALAYAIAHGDAATRKAAAESLPQVARIGTHLYHFVRYALTQRGWGRSLRWAISNWYVSRDLGSLAYDAIKYRQRDGWSHRDLLRVSHPTAQEKPRAALFDWIVRGDESEVWNGEPISGSELLIVNGFSAAQRSESPAKTADLVREFRLPREALLPDHLTDPEVWRALLDVGMPLHALTRNLANMTRIGVLEGDYRRLVVEQFGDGDAVQKSRLHPLAILLALSTYAAGRGMRGQNEWTPIPAISDALDAAFYLAFDNVEPTGKKTLLALDVSGSMSHPLAGSPLSCREASAALALVALATETDVDVVGFSHELIPLALSGRQRLDDAVRSISGIPFGRTDCALPMLYATRTGKEYETFVVYTDSETWYGNVHPHQALAAYRNQTGIPARLAVVAMVPNEFSIADPKDGGMLDVVGFDTATPQIVADFATGRV